MLWGQNSILHGGFRNAVLGAALAMLTVTSGCSCEQQSAEQSQTSSTDKAGSTSPNGAKNGARTAADAQKSTLETQGDGQSGAPAPSSAAQARTAAEQLARQAESQAAAGDSGQAFATVTAAIDLLRKHADDPECQALEASLMAAARNYGEKANGQNTAPPAKPIVVDN